MKTSELSSDDSILVRIVDTIKKSDIDEWNYRGLELSNGILCVLISHPKLDKAAAAINVSIGDLGDPNDVPGIAHFLEHMLFMGSSKYPNENEFSKFIENNGGISNAYTSTRETNYHFDINPNVLADALDIFANFFISPLFSSSSVEREIQAVNSEFERYLSSDAWRISQMEKSTLDPEHPYSRFGTGNIESLQTIPKESGIDIREALVQFYEDHYSANRMSLVVLSNHSLDDLQSFVISSFKDVPNKQLLSQRYPPDPFGETGRKTIYYVVPIAESRQMKISWVIPDFQEIYRCLPIWYLSFLINHEGTDSLFSYLKRMGLVLEVTSYAAAQIAPGFNIFSIEIELTIDGLKQWERIVFLIYQYMTMIRNEGIQEWIFNEGKNMFIKHFQFAEKESPFDFVTNLASRMRKCETCGTIDDFKLPLPNDFIPTDFQLYHRQEETSIITRPQLPKKIKENEYYRLYYTEDRFYKLPKAFLYFDLSNSLVNIDPNHLIMNRIYVELVTDSLSSLTYPARRAGIYYELSASSYGIELNIYGFNHKIGILLEKIIDHLINLKIDQQRFEILRENEKQRLKNYHVDEPVSMASCGIYYLTSQYQWNNDELLNCIDDITLHDMDTFIRTLFTRFYVDSLMYGNITENQAIEYMTIFQRKFHEKHLFRPLFPSMWFIRRHLMLPDGTYRNKYFINKNDFIVILGCNFAYTMLNDGYRTNAIHVYLQCFHETLENNALINLFVQLIQESCYNQLRTKEQLGYIVRSGVHNTQGVYGVEIILQSNSEPEYLNQRIEIFLDSIRDYFEQMSNDEFEKQRNAFIIKSLEISKRMEDQGDIFWSEITSHEFCFDRPPLLSEILRKFERKDLIQFYDH
ncbi:unnamed protein product, partial [Adineta ricciae]